MFTDFSKTLRQFVAPAGIGAAIGGTLTYIGGYFSRSVAYEYCQAIPTYMSGSINDIALNISGEVVNFLKSGIINVKESIDIPEAMQQFSEKFWSSSAAGYVSAGIDTISPWVPSVDKIMGSLPKVVMNINPVGSYLAVQTYSLATKIAAHAIINECQNKVNNVNITPFVIAGSVLTGSAVLAYSFFSICRNRQQNTAEQHEYTNRLKMD